MLAFVHIPKTAGTTLHKIISHQYPRIFIHHDSNGPPSADLAKHIIERDPQVVMGHFSVGLHHFLPEIRYITCLREPISRIVSHYQHALNDPAHYLHQTVLSGKLDLTSYVSSGISGELSNGMTRMIAGVENFHHSTVDEQTLARAKSNIETYFDSVILSEFFDQGLLMLGDFLQWKTPYYLRRKVGKYSTTSRKLNDSDRSAIREYNHLDCELYSWAKQRFENQTANIPGLADRTTSFQKSNRFLGKSIFCLRELKRSL